eukprot:5180116-Ditylum_brightwellii.AAC.1
MLASCLSAFICSSPIWAKVSAGCGFWRERIKSRVAYVAAFFDDICGIFTAPIMVGGWFNVPAIYTAPLSCASADSCRLMCNGQRRFKVSRACGRSQSHSFSGKLGSALHRPEIKWALK